MVLGRNPLWTQPVVDKDGRDIHCGRLIFDGNKAKASPMNLAFVEDACALTVDVTIRTTHQDRDISIRTRTLGIDAKLEPCAFWARCVAPAATVRAPPALAAGCAWLSVGPKFSRAFFPGRHHC